ncbi:MAG TPA: ribosome small subunit-dependent GTPase A [Phycisphaerae bacterium]|nr:ribosome small subunit-dependent GTPase A [Phycisphaerae bacterium]HNU44140.1 ribosome small subunit-dependent GTPase A [Phycisphaerae bacterium]
MSTSGEPTPPQKGRKVRADLRRNRLQPGRRRDWTQRALAAEDHELDTRSTESVSAKGDLSRRRTITVRDRAAALAAGLHLGTVVAMRGLYADVDDGTDHWPCTIRRLLRTRLIAERQPITVGDRVYFRPRVEAGQAESRTGVIEDVEPRHSQLCRRTDRRVHAIVANVDQVLIVTSAALPDPKPHLIDRYIVATLAGGMTPVICLNKVDLDAEGVTRTLLEVYQQLEYPTLCTSVVTGEGIDALRGILHDKASVVAGQSGVGKSSLLNAVQPGLKLKVGDIIEQTQKGRHTTVTATLLTLDGGGYVVDTPGVRSFDLSLLNPHELEVYFAEFVPLVPACKFPDCSHTHEIGCAVKDAVEAGRINPQRYESYIGLFAESGGATGDS